MRTRDVVVPSIGIVKLRHPRPIRPQDVGNAVRSSLCLLFNSSAGTSSRRALKAEMRARTNDEIM